jgi:hypothetical protein
MRFRQKTDYRARQAVSSNEPSTQTSPCRKAFLSSDKTKLVVPPVDSVLYKDELVPALS